MKKFDCILLVDDNEIDNYVSSTIIKHLKITENIHVSYTVEEAIKFVKKFYKENKKGPDLIILDIKMPAVDGFEFLKAYKKLSIENKDKIILMVLSSSDEIGDLKKLSKYDTVDYYINKPLTLEQMQSFLENLPAKNEGM
jgi:CheY-like chemotaxis protein